MIIYDESLGFVNPCSECGKLVDGLVCDCRKSKEQKDLAKLLETFRKSNSLLI